MCVFGGDIPTSEEEYERIQDRTCCSFVPLGVSSGYCHGDSNARKVTPQIMIGHIQGLFVVKYMLIKGLLKDCSINHKQSRLEGKYEPNHPLQGVTTLRKMT